MCGIFLLLNNNNKTTDEFIQEQFNKGKNRGPEYSNLTNLTDKCSVGFHRLAINGLDEKSNQPFYIKNTMLICNGEIYNYKELYNLMKIEPETNSDCEVIIHLYRKYGIEQTLHMLDGVFSFILYDLNLSSQQMYVARDPYGIRPLYKFADNINKTIGFASELKSLISFVNSNCVVNQFQPGSYQMIHYNIHTELWGLTENVRYHSTSTFSNFGVSPVVDVYKNIQFYLQNAVNKRCLATERPIACLLSGGLDSSLITALVNEYYKRNNNGKKLETFSIGLANSEDIKYARIVADYLQTDHTEIIVTEDDFLNSIPEVIQNIESYDTTSVRACLGNYALGKYISKHSDAKVIFNGDGSDELCGGYLYMYRAPDAIEFDKESRRLLKYIHLFDVLRSDKSISSHGLEPRTPFLDKDWVQYYLSIHPSIRFHPGNMQCEKFLLRTAFSPHNFLNTCGEPLLPDKILWRTKEAFSDGVSGHGRSLFTILQEKIVDLKMENVQFDKYSHLTPTTLEQYYYRTIFEERYPNVSSIVPYFWMPKYIDATDPSARTLKVYDMINKKN